MLTGVKHHAQHLTEHLSFTKSDKCHLIVTVPGAP